MTPAPDENPIPILGGTGALGYGLAVRWAQAGLSVVIGSRDADRAAEAAAKVREAVDGADVEGLGNEEAAAKGPIVFLTVPFRAQSETLNNLRGALKEGQTLVDCTVPLAAAVSGKATRSLGVWQGSAAQQAQEMVPDGVTVVSALHTVGAPTLSDLGATLDEDVLVCGDKKKDKAPVARLIERIDGPPRRQRRPARDRADRRAADPASDLDQRPLQGARRAEADGSPRRRPLGVMRIAHPLRGGEGT